MLNGERNNFLRTIFIAFCIIQIVFDGFLIMNILNQNSRINTQDKLISDFVDQANILAEKFYMLSVFHNTEVESRFIGNEKLKETTKDFLNAMNIANNTDFDKCIAQFKDPIILEEPRLESGSSKVTGYVIHLYDKFTFDEIGTTTFEEDFVEYEVYGCGKVTFNETAKRIEFDMSQYIDREVMQ